MIILNNLWHIETLKWHFERKLFWRSYFTQSVLNLKLEITYGILKESNFNKIISSPLVSLKDNSVKNVYWLFKGFWQSEHKDIFLLPKEILRLLTKWFNSIFECLISVTAIFEKIFGSIVFNKEIFNKVRTPHWSK